MSCLTSYVSSSGGINETNYINSSNFGDRSANYWVGSTGDSGIVVWLLYNSSIMEATIINDTLFQSQSFNSLVNLMIQYLDIMKYDKNKNNEGHGDLYALINNLNDEQDFYTKRYVYAVKQVMNILNQVDALDKAPKSNPYWTAFCQAVNGNSYSFANGVDPFGKLIQSYTDLNCTVNISSAMQTQLNTYIKNAHTLNNQLFTLGVATKILGDIIV